MIYHSKKNLICKLVRVLVCFPAPCFFSVKIYGLFCAMSFFMYDSKYIKKNKKNNIENNGLHEYEKWKDFQ